MNTDERVVTYIYSNLDNSEQLLKGIDKTKNHLEQRQVRTKFGVHTKGVWVANEQPILQPKKTYHKSSPDTKLKVKKLSEQLGNEELMELAKSKGITWDEHPLRKVNIMRMKMAISKAMEEGIWDIVPETSAKRLVYLVQKPEDTNVSIYDDILYGLTKSSKSTYETEHFSDILDNATDENFRNFRTLGICAGDEGAEEYLSDLYEKYKSTISNNLVNGIRDKLSGVVSQNVITVINNSLKNAKKQVRYVNHKDVIMDSWTIPLCSTLKKRFNGKFSSSTNGYDSDVNGEAALTVVNKMKAFPEYKELAEEYYNLRSEYHTLKAELSELYAKDGYNYHFVSSVSTVANNYCRLGMSDDQIITLYRTKFEKSINFYKKEISELEKKKANNPDATWIDNELERHRKDLENFEECVNNTSKETLLRYANISKLYDKMFNPKFDYININLYHTARVVSELSQAYNLQTDVVEEWPILTPEEIDSVDTGDDSVKVNLALTAATFKPSLQGKKQTPQEIMFEKFEERRELLETYGGSIECKNKKYYSEDNEIRCKVSSVTGDELTAIKNMIKNDWDRKVHRGMTYEILGVYKVSDLEVEQEYNSLVEEHKIYQDQSNNNHNQQQDWFYHGTGSLATSLILGHSGQFKVVKAKVGRMLGDGIYLADKSSKSAQYISDAGYSRHGTEGSLMLVQASLGNTVDYVYSNWREKENADTVAGSVTNSHLLNNEWCVKNPQSVIPRYLVHMKVK